MTFYSALLPPAGRPDTRAWPVMVACRMSWLVLLCGWGGLLLRGCLVSGLLAGGVSILLVTFVPLAFALPMLGGLHLLLALNTPEIRQWELQLRGYASAAGVYAPDRSAALVRWLEHNRPVPPPSPVS
ncbi:hypothetical protein CFR75_06535 [Komagataeibacter xylinus]|uniref:Uncharacterized protein n=1 Tax=Komagataeibacter xylinus TaxID=28448 RepID=A0A318PJB9_KOMXY|nr:hypothetical protein [Komagataeibacter xylinus]AZV38669.1 hypothetical protein CXP35_07490 [Komagataeibacter xylinus]PYD57254.1 hypothetical protein CFR75_06535 [Komagataeibacter xylinus]GBQ77487.1 hypothetical protein AA15237_2562 [Komagataeibacter xylinus NBRC 15237]